LKQILRKYLKTGLPILWLLFPLLFASCTRSIPSPSVMVQFPNTPTAQASTGENIQKKTIEATKIIDTDTPINISDNPMILEIGHLNKDLLIFTIQFSFQTSAEDHIVTIKDTEYDCVLQDKFNNRLYCFGPFVTTKTALVIIESATEQYDRIAIEMDLSTIQ